MASVTTSSFLQHLRRAILLPGGNDRTDGQLLESFLLRRDETAFQALVHRHGSMVLGVCRRVLHQAHDAEDAFQATFLVLVRKAPSLLNRQTIGNWLYGVAHYTALKARAATMKRRAKESQARQTQESTEAVRDTWLDLRSLLDQELSRLPEKYRAPVVLCHLEGRAREVVARLLRIPEGTLSSRLATARSMLARRLARRGLVLSSGVLAAALTPNSASAEVAAPLVVAAVKAASVLVAEPAAAGAIPAQVAALTEGVMRTMALSRNKMVLTILLGAAVLATGVSAILRPAPRVTAAEKAPPAAPAPDGVKELAPAGKPAPAAAAAPDRLDVVLRHWEREMTSLSSLRAQVIRTTEDKTFRTVEVYEGTFQFQKPSRGLLELHKRGEAGVFEKYICSGTRLYEYAPREKVIRVHELPPPRSPLLDLVADSLPAFLLGPKAEEARRRYELKLVKEDQWYVYIEILPRVLGEGTRSRVVLPFHLEKAAEFHKARLVLYRSTFLPRQLWLEQPNGNEITWDFPRLERNVSFDHGEFDAPKPANGWRLLRLSKPDYLPGDAPPADEQE